MNIKGQLDPILEKWDLLKHPFYEAWSAGTLPMEALRVYAREYEGFISTLPLGWENLKDEATAEEEREHAEMWAGFRSVIGEGDDMRTVPQAEQRALTARELFTSPASALGALYAFERQQPATAQSKLEGLQSFYGFAEEPYFKAHSSNWHESEKILKQMEALSPADQQEARLACERMAAALWDALSGIHSATCKD